MHPVALGAGLPLMHGLPEPQRLEPISSNGVRRRMRHSGPATDLTNSERQARRYVNVAVQRPDGVPVPERTAVFTVRLAPSLIGGLRERASATGQTLSAVTAEAVRGYLAGAGERGGGQAS